MAFTCDANDLLNSAKCLMDQCMGQEERDAIDIYLRVQNLAAIGGADYTDDLNALLQAAKEWQALAPNQRKAIDLWIDMQNAIDNGASIDQDPNALAAAAKCYLCLGEDTKKALQSFLKCAINTLGEPD